MTCEKCRKVKQRGVIPLEGPVGVQWVCIECLNLPEIHSLFKDDYRILVQTKANDIGIALPTNPWRSLK